MNKPKYKIIRQSNSEKLYAHSIADIANYLSSTPGFVKLHLDKPVQLNGWEIKTTINIQ